MVRKDIIEMSTEEIRRAGVLEETKKSRITQKRAAEIIGISERQVRRLLRKVRKEGIESIIHGSRGAPGSRRIPDRIREEVLKIHKEKYPDFGPTFAVEKLYENHAFVIDHDTLRRWLLKEGREYDWQRRKRPHRQWRERKACFGEMVQMDGSHHDWLEGKGPKLVLMGYIDDATGTVFAWFYLYEGTQPALDSIYRYIRIHGVPQSVYLDNHGTYKSNKKRTVQEELLNEKSLTQFSRAMKELGVQLIYARSPQAKGRVERLFRTFQDRLVKEMRLVGISTLEEANVFLEDYLPKYNRRFGKHARNETNVHRKAPKKRDLDAILSIQEKRLFQKDSTIRYKTKCYLFTNVPKRRIKKVIVEERLDGSVHIRYGKEYLQYKEIDKSLIIRSIEQEEKEEKKKEKYKPPANHSWRHYRIQRYPQFHKESQKEKFGQKEKHLEMPRYG